MYMLNRDLRARKLDYAAATHDQADQEDHEEHEKQDLRDTSSRASDAAEAKHRRDQRDDQENESIVKHLSNPPLFNTALEVPNAVLVYYRRNEQEKEQEKDG